MRAPTDSADARGRDGFILIAALWILAALAGLVGMYAVYVSVATREAAVYASRLNAEEAIYSAVEMTVFQISGARDIRTPARGAFEFQSGAFATRVRFVSDAARLDLNLASREALSRLFAAVGPQGADPDELAARIIGWRTFKSEGSADGEAALYAGAGRAYGPRRGLFQSVDELWLLVGFSPELVRRVLPYVTVFGMRVDVDGRVADPVLIGAGLARGADKAGQGDEPPPEPPPRVVRLDVEARRGGGPPMHVDIALILTPDDDEPYYILSWRAE